MHTLNKQQFKLYERLIKEYNQVCNFCSLDSFLQKKLDSAYYNIKDYGSSLEYYYNVREVKLFAENDY